MLKICGALIWKRLGNIYKSCIYKCRLSSEWIKANVVSFLKKGGKEQLENYPTKLLLTICGNILERLLNNIMIEFYIENALIFPNPSKLLIRLSINNYP